MTTPHYWRVYADEHEATGCTNRVLLVWEEDGVTQVRRCSECRMVVSKVWPVPTEPEPTEPEPDA